MGQRGPLPMTNEERERKGLPLIATDGSIILPAEAPDMPADLPDEARAEWERVVPVLLELGIITKADGGVLEDYVRTYALHRDAANTLSKQGVVFAGEQHPAWPVYRQASAMLEKLRKELGLSPATRARMPRATRLKTSASEP